MRTSDGARHRIATIALACAAVLPLAAIRSEAATVVVINADDPGEGFHDLTPVEPVGGNPGTTLGQQRLFAFRYAAELWAAQLDTTVDVQVIASFDPLDCDAFSVTLGIAGPVNVFSDFEGAPRPDTWYASALANKLAGMDLAPDDDDIDATFNSTFGTTCAFDASWYYGFDRAIPEADTDFVTVALHELAHGLGFLTFIDVETGQRLSSMDDPDGKDDAFMQFLFDNDTGKVFTEMSDQERASASRATFALRWNGANVTAASGTVAVGVDESGRVEMYAPPMVQPGSSVSHWSDDVRPIELLAPFFETPIHEVGLTLPALFDLGWADQPLACQADCDGNAQVTIDELIVAVRIALGDAALASCGVADANDSGAIEVNELVGAVARALGGCAG